jgi:hypothetical protein
VQEEYCVIDKDTRVLSFTVVGPGGVATEVQTTVPFLIRQTRPAK